MKDLDKDFGEEINGEAENQNNQDFFEREDNDNKNSENVEAGVQENEKILEDEKEDNAQKEEGACEEGKMPATEGADNSTEGGVNPEKEREYSSCYTPPYYVPNFTTVSSNSGTGTSVPPSAPKKEKKQIWKIVLLAFAAAIVALLMLAFGALTFIKIFFGKDDDELDIGKENLNIVQNAPQVQINKNTDSDYVPKSLPEVVSKVGNSVVEIKTSSRVSDRFYGQYVTSGAGSGVIVTQSDEAGYLLTNYHVIYTNEELADTITVVLTNGEEYTATEVGSDYNLDLAVLRIEKKDKESFTVASFGDSSKLVVGQQVVAIGNPLGSLGGTVTDGIISALDRQVKIDDVTMTLLQHSAAINPGNSGGALFDMMGNLIGVVNAKTSEVGIEGLGFAIPSNIAFSFFNRVMVTEPAIGIKVAYGRPNLAAPIGLYVVDVTNSDFKKYDRILKVNGQQVNTSPEYYAIIDCFNKGDEVTITVKRDGATVDVKVVISE